MSKQIEALKLALEALENLPEMCGIEEAITAVQEALAEQPAQQEPEPDRVKFERHWRKTRGDKKANRELPRHPLQPQTYIQDSANRHWVTWQAAVRSVSPQPAQQQEQGDPNCQDADGCPTEMAVLQRFWRGEPIPTEHHPAWFKPSQQEGCQCPSCKVTPHTSDCAIHNAPAYPVGTCDCGAQPDQEPVAMMTVLHLKDRTEIGYGPKSAGYDLPTGEYKLYTSPPASKPLTDEEIWDEVKAADLDWQTGWSLDEDASNRYITFARAIEAAHGIKGDA